MTVRFRTRWVELLCVKAQGPQGALLLLFARHVFFTITCKSRSAEAVVASNTVDAGAAMAARHVPALVPIGLALVARVAVLAEARVSAFYCPLTKQTIYLSIFIEPVAPLELARKLHQTTRQIVLLAKAVVPNPKSQFDVMCVKHKKLEF